MPAYLGVTAVDRRSDFPRSASARRAPAGPGGQAPWTVELGALGPGERWRAVQVTCSFESGRPYHPAAGVPGQMIEDVNGPAADRVLPSSATSLPSTGAGQA